MSTTRSVGEMLDVEMEPECREQVLVGYAGVESDDVYDDKPHPVPEWSAVLVPLLERTQHVSGVLDVAGQAGDVALQPAAHELGNTLGGSVYTWRDGSPWRVRLVDLGQQMELMAPHVVRLCKCPAAGDVVDVSVDMELVDKLMEFLAICTVGSFFTLL